MSDYIDSKIDGSFLPADIDFLGRYVRKLKAGDIYMEIGTEYGKSMASAIWQAEEGVKFYTCDLVDKPVEKEGMMSRREFFESEGLDKICTFIKGDSVEISKGWQDELAMVFIDSEHTYAAIKKDIKVWYPHLKTGGYMLFHDYGDTQFTLYLAVDEYVRDSDKFGDFVKAQDMGLINSSMAGAVKA